VSQSVEEDHPRAFDFLRHDIGNVEAFFYKKGVKTLGSKRAWEFITGSKHENAESSVRALLEEPHDPIDDAVFMASFIPRSLGEVYDPERDVDLVNAGRGDELIYAEMAGLGVGSKVKVSLDVGGLTKGTNRRRRGVCRNRGRGV
jgi:RIO kinase 1